MSIRHDLHTLIDEMFDNAHPKQGLSAFRELTGNQLPWIEQMVINRARTEGMSWAMIGRCLGRSRQGLQARFGSMQPTVGPRRSESRIRRQARLQTEAFLLLKSPAPPEPVIDDDTPAW